MIPPKWFSGLVYSGFKSTADNISLELRYILAWSPKKTFFIGNKWKNRCTRRMPSWKVYSKVSVQGPNAAQTRGKNLIFHLSPEWNIRKKFPWTRRMLFWEHCRKIFDQSLKKFCSNPGKKVEKLKQSQDLLKMLFCTRRKQFWEHCRNDQSPKYFIQGGNKKKPIYIFRINASVCSSGRIDGKFENNVNSVFFNRRKIPAWNSRTGTFIEKIVINVPCTWRRQLWGVRWKEIV